MYLGVCESVGLRCAMCAVNGARPGQAERTQDVCRDLAPALGLDTERGAQTIGRIPSIISPRPRH